MAAQRINRPLPLLPHVSDFLGALSGTLVQYLVDDVVHLCCEYAFYLYIDFSQQQIETEQKHETDIQLFCLRSQDQNLSIAIQGLLPYGIKKSTFGLAKLHMSVYGANEEVLRLFNMADEDCHRLVPVKNANSAVQIRTLCLGADGQGWVRLSLPITIYNNNPPTCRNVELDRLDAQGKIVANTKGRIVKLTLSRRGVWYHASKIQERYGTAWHIREIMVLDQSPASLETALCQSQLETPQPSR